MFCKRIAIIIITLFCSLAVFAQNRYDVVIDELMADPTPQVGLPGVEFIEIKNVTNANIVLTGWRLSDATGQSGPLPNYTLKPDSFLIVCSSGSLAQLSTFGPAVSVTSFPSLDNDGDVISLRSNTGRIIHSISYTTAWYQNPAKTDGGWTLEMIDTRNPCGGIDNWKASVDTRGGTPGIKNSVDAVNADNNPPQLARTYTVTATQIVAVFNEPIDSTIGAVVGNYTLANGPAISSAVPVAPLFQQVTLNLSAPLAANTVYELTVRNVPDCKGNAIGSFNKARSGLPVDADSLDIIVNEILFNPKPNNFDFVEVYNRSNKIFDASKLYIANRNTAGAIANVKKLSEQPCLIFPGDFITVTESAVKTKEAFLVKNPDWLIEIPSMPSFNDDEGNVILLNFQGRIMDQVSYKDDWHFKLIDDEEGISLERIDYTSSSQNPDTWHSASFTSGYGTPTEKNSQFNTGNFGNGEITISPKTFSPDNDGRDDILTINYQFGERSYIANIVIYDAAGRPVKQLKKNDLLGFKGSWTWDGLNDKFEKLPTGIYVVWVEVFNLQGKKKQFKNTVVLARRLS
jgi:hypothetical protein